MTDVFGGAESGGSRYQEDISDTMSLRSQDDTARYVIFRYMQISDNIIYLFKFNAPFSLFYHFVSVVSWGL
jgi:hypothetical protein